MRISNESNQNQITEKLITLADLILYGYNSGPHLILRFDDHFTEVSLEEWLASVGQPYQSVVEKVHTDLRTTLQKHNALDTFHTLLYGGAIPAEEKPSSSTSLKRQDTGALTTGIFNMEPGIIHLIRPNLPTRTNEYITNQIKNKIEMFVNNANKEVIACLNENLDQLAPIRNAYNLFIQQRLTQLSYSQSQSSIEAGTQSLPLPANDGHDTQIARTNSGGRPEIKTENFEIEECDTDELVTRGQRYLNALSEFRSGDRSWHLNQKGFANIATSTLFFGKISRNYQSGSSYLIFYTYFFTPDSTIPIDTPSTAAANNLSHWLTRYGLSTNTEIKPGENNNSGVVKIIVTGFSKSLVAKLKRLRDAKKNGEQPKTSNNLTNNTSALFTALGKHSRDYSDGLEPYDFENPYEDDEKEETDPSNTDSISKPPFKLRKKEEYEYASDDEKGGATFFL